MPAHESLEDTASDILAKAMNGLKLSPSLIAEQTGASEEDIRECLKAEIENTMWDTVSQVLRLDSQKLKKIAESPGCTPLELPKSLHLLILPFGPFTANAYALVDENSRECLFFDAGTQPNEFFEFLNDHELKPKAMLLTHICIDHVSAIPELLKKYPEMELYAPAKEAYEGSQPVDESFEYSFGKFTITTAEVPGHTKGGMCYYIQGLSQPAAIVGDSLYKGSIGKIRLPDYIAALEVMREKILTLPAETLICPGHGPVSTVADEIINNPFF